MEPLFEAKAKINKQMTLYNIFRLHQEKYKAKIISKEDADIDETAPAELVLVKNNGIWHTEDNMVSELSTALGSEIDVFNYGYGDLLGRIGIE